MKHNNSKQSLLTSLQSILDNSSMIVTVYDLEGNYLMVNNVAQKLAGRTLNKKLIGNNIYSVLAKEIADKVMKDNEEAIRKKKTIEVKTTVQFPDGTHVFRASRVPLFDIEGKVYAVCSIATDITDNTGSEKGIKKLSTELEQKVTERTHEVIIMERVPIPNMQGFDMVPVKEIVRFEADGGYTHVFLSSGKKIVSTKAISYFSGQWHGSLFFRTHRTHLINISHIIRYHSGSNTFAEMCDGSHIPIARKEKQAFLQRIKTGGAGQSPPLPKKGE